MMRIPGNGDIPAGCHLTFAVSLVVWLCIFHLINRWMGWW